MKGKIKKTLGRKVLSFALAVAMVVSLMTLIPRTDMQVKAAGTATVGSYTIAVPSDATSPGTSESTAVTAVNSSDTNWNAGWYVVNDDIVLDNRVTVYGDVNLILVDGKTLKANQGIRVTKSSTYNNATFTIWGQNMGTGTIIAESSSLNAAIGSNNRDSKGPSGHITINGGTVEATCSDSAAGIGGGFYSSCSAVTINGGTVMAKGGQYASGIGGGNCGSGGTITINGGIITAITKGQNAGSNLCCAIGKGNEGQGYGTTKVTINNLATTGYVVRAGKSESAAVIKNNESDDWTTILGGGVYYVKIGPPHAHNWQYSADGNVLKAYCTADGCPSNTSSTSQKSISISASSPDFTGSPVEPTITYGTAQEAAGWTDAGIVLPGTSADGAPIITKKYYNTGASGSKMGDELNVAPTAVGKYVVDVKISYGDGKEGTVSLTYDVNKVTATVSSAPSPVSSLTYDGNSKALITAGTTNDGTIQYSLSSTGPYTENIPTGTNAGNYTVYYKVVGDANHNDSTPASVTSTIGKAAFPEGLKPAAGKTIYVAANKSEAQSGTITLETIGISTSALEGAEIKGVSEIEDTSNIITSVSSASYTTGTNLADQTTAKLAVIVSSNNYEDFTYDLTVSVKAKTQLTIGGTSAPASNPVYTGSPISNNIFGTPTVSGGEFAATGLIYTYVGREGTSYGPLNTPPTNAGKYKVTIAVPEDNETYMGFVSIDFEITKSTPKVPSSVTAVSPTSATATDGKITGLDTTMEYSTDDGSSWNPAPASGEITDLEAGTKIKVRVKASDNYNDGEVKDFEIPTYKAPSSGQPAPATPEGGTIAGGETGGKDIEVNVSGGNAVVDDIPSSVINEAANSHPNSDEIIINVSSGGEDVSKVTLTKTTVEAISKVLESGSNNKENLTIKSDTAKVSIDATALKSIAGQAKGEDIQLVVENTQETKLNDNQKSQLEALNTGKKSVEMTFEAYFVSGGARISYFNGGEIKIVKIDHTIPVGMDEKYIHVFYMHENRAPERPTTWVEDRNPCFITTHCSDFAIVYDETQETGEPIESKIVARMYNPSTGDHFYTTNMKEAEAAKVAYRYEAKSYFKVDGTGSVIYRAYHPVSGDHFYTSNKAEWEYSAKYGYTLEGIAFTSSKSGKQILRMYNPSNGDHFYTTSAAEAKSAEKLGYRYEGVAFYVN